MFQPLYKFVSPKTLEEKHRKITELMKVLGDIPKGHLPEWAAWGKMEGYRTEFGLILDYKNPSENTYNDYCAHIERLKEIAGKNNLALSRTADYASFVNRFGREFALITYSTLSHTPDMAVIKNTKQARMIIDECMQDFKKAV